MNAQPLTIKKSRCRRNKRCCRNVDLVIKENRVVLALHMRSHDDGLYSVANVPALARATGLSKGSVESALSRLGCDGHIKEFDHNGIHPRRNVILLMNHPCAARIARIARPFEERQQVRELGCLMDSILEGSYKDGLDDFVVAEDYEDEVEDDVWIDPAICPVNYRGD